jgi:hypothetical protein
VQCFWLSVGRSAGDQRRFLPNNIYNSALQRVTALGGGGVNYDPIQCSRSRMSAKPNKFVDNSLKFEIITPNIVL